MKIPELKPQQIWVTVAILCFIIPGFFPLGTPFQMSDIVLEIYALVDSLPEGSIVVIGGSGVFAFDLECATGTIACVRQMNRNGLKIVLAPLGTEAVQLERYIIDMARIDTSFGGSAEYGVDWMALPYLPGGSSALVSLLNDVHGTVSTDVYGTPLADLPLGQEFNSWEDIALWICPHWGYSTIVRYCTAERGIPSIYFATSGGYSLASPYMAAYPGLSFLTNGYLGGAQYEKLEGIKGLGHAVIDAYQVLSLLFIGIWVLGNLTQYYTNRQEELAK